MRTWRRQNNSQTPDLTLFDLVFFFMRLSLPYSMFKISEAREQ